MRAGNIGGTNSYIYAAATSFLWENLRFNAVGLSLGEEYITYPDGLAGCVQDERQPKHGGGKAYEHSAKGYSLQLHWLSKNKTKVRVGRCPP